MDKILDQRAKSLNEKILNILCGYAFAFIWCTVVGNAFQAMGASMSSFSIPSLISAVVIAPLWEEFVFRHSVVKLTFKLDVFYRMPIIVVSSVVFGWLHGGVMNVFFQGVIGFCIAIVYIRNNYCYWSAVAFHATWNLMLFFI